MGLGITTPGAGFGQKQSAAIPKIDHKASVEETLPGGRNVGDASNTKTATPIQSPTAPPTPAQSEGASQAASIPQKQTWQATVTDIVQQMLTQNIPNTPTSKALALLMMQYGIELSADNFEQLFKLLKGKTKKSALESAIISMTKGLEQQPDAVDFLDAFLSKSIQMADQLKKLQASFSQLQTALLRADSDQGLAGRLAALLSEFDDTIKKLLKKARDKTLNLTSFNRGNFLKDVYSFKQLLSGIRQNNTLFTDPDILKKMVQAEKNSQHLIGNLASQIMLSKDSEKQPLNTLENFAYWQIPNPLSAEQAQPTMIDILIKKDAQKTNDKSINPQKTKMILQFETEPLGEITVTVVVLDNKTWITVHSENEQTTKLVSTSQKELKDRIESINYELTGFQSVRKKIDLKKLILPTQNLDNIVRINAEI